MSGICELHDAKFFQSAHNHFCGSLVLVALAFRVPSPCTAGLYGWRLPVGAKSRCKGRPSLLPLYRGSQSQRHPSRSKAPPSISASADSENTNLSASMQQCATAGHSQSGCVTKNCVTSRGVFSSIGCHVPYEVMPLPSLLRGQQAASCLLEPWRCRSRNLVLSQVSDRSKCR